jgi:hypothetical protein
MRGSVTLERDGKESPAQLGYVYRHDALETGADGEARVRFPGGRLVQLGANSRFVLDEDANGLVLQVPKGTLISSSEETPEGGRALSIQTPFGRTELGTNKNGLSLEVGKDGAKVDVLLGEVQLLSNNGERGKAAQGDKVELTLGKIERVDSAGKPPPSELPPLEVLVTDTGPAELRKKGQRRWVPLKKGLSVGEGDAIRVRSGRSVLKVADNSLAMTSGSEVTFNGAARDGAVDTSSVDVSKGGLSLSLAQGRRSRVNVGPIQLESTTGGQFVVAKTPDGYDVAAITGDVVAKKGGVEQPIEAGQLARLGKRGNEVHSGGGSELVLASRTGTQVFHPGTMGEVTLSWPGEKKNYYVEVAYDSELKEKLAAGLVHQPSITVDAPRQRALFWRVFEADGKTQVDRGSASFRPEFNAEASSGAFRDTVQEGSERTTIFYQSNLPAVTLTWKTDDQAAKYRLRVFKASALDAPVVDRTATAERVSLEPGALAEGNYLWSVTPLSAAGDELRGGKMTKLDIVYDNAVPSLVVKSPRNGDAAAGKVQAVGVATVGSRVLINGKAAGLDEKGRFDEPASPAGRPPSVVFRLLRNNASDVVVIRTLRKGTR